MATPAPSDGSLAACSKRLARRILTIGENRLALLAVELQEGGVRLVHAVALALGVAVFGLLAVLTASAALVVLLWDYSPVGVLSLLTFLYGAAGASLARRLAGLQRNWQLLAASLEQLRKDRACLDERPT